MLIESPDDGKHDAIATRRIREARHGAGATADFAEGAFNGVGGPHAPPVVLGDRIEGQQRFPVAQDTRHRRRGGGLPGAHPLLQRPLGGGPSGGEIDAPGQGQTPIAVPHAETLGDVAEDVDPTGLAPDLRIDEFEGGVQAPMSIRCPSVVIRRSDAPVRPRQARWIRKGSHVDCDSWRTSR